MKEESEKLGICIKGGGKGSKGNPLDKEDDGIFISKVRMHTLRVCVCHSVWCQCSLV